MQCQPSPEMWGSLGTYVAKILTDEAGNPIQSEAEDLFTPDLGQNPPAN